MGRAWEVGENHARVPQLHQLNPTHKPESWLTNLPVHLWRDKWTALGRPLSVRGVPGRWARSMRAWRSSTGTRVTDVTCQLFTVQYTVLWSQLIRETRWSRPTRRSAITQIKRRKKNDSFGD